MGKQEQRAYLEAIRTRYRRAGKAGKTAILDEFCAVCEYHRKYALKLLSNKHRQHKKAKRKPGTGSRYGTPELVEVLRAIWLASDQLCSKRLKAALPLWLPHYDRPLSPETRVLLDTISAASIDRLLKPIRAKVARKGLSGTPPNLPNDSGWGHLLWVTFFGKTRKVTRCRAAPSEVALLLQEICCLHIMCMGKSNQFIDYGFPAQ